MPSLDLNTYGVDVFGRPDVAVGGSAFSEAIGERSSEILVVNL